MTGGPPSGALGGGYRKGGHMQAYRIALTVDQEWLDAISRMTQDVYDGEVCFWESISAPFDIDPDTYNMSDQEFLEILNGEG